MEVYTHVESPVGKYIVISPFVSILTAPILLKLTSPSVYQADPHFILGLKPSGTKKQVVIPTLGELQWKYPFIYTFPLCL